MPRLLGANQRHIMDAMRRHGGVWHARCGWTWNGASETERLLNSVLPYGLVEVDEAKSTLNHKAFTLTEKGRTVDLMSSMTRSHEPAESGRFQHTVTLTFDSKVSLSAAEVKEFVIGALQSEPGHHSPESPFRDITNPTLLNRVQSRYTGS